MSEEWKPDKFDYADLAEHYRLAREEIKRLQGEYAALATEVRKVATMFTCTDPTCPCGGAPVIEFEEAHISEAELPALAKVLKEMSSHSDQPDTRLSVGDEVEIVGPPHAAYGRREVIGRRGRVEYVHNDGVAAVRDEAGDLWNYSPIALRLKNE